MLVRMAEQVSADCPWLWLQALFIAELWWVGELRFDTAFEIEGGSPEVISAISGLQRLERMAPERAVWADIAI
jgi:hypothetical protein